MKHINFRAVAIAALAVGACSGSLLARPAGPAPAQDSDATTSVDSAQGAPAAGSGVIDAPPTQASVDPSALPGAGRLSAAGLGLAALGLMASLRRKREEH